MIKNIVFHFDTLKMTPIPVTWHFLPPTYIFTQFKTNMLNIQAALKKWFVILEKFPDLPSCTDFDIINTTSNVRKLKKIKLQSAGEKCSIKTGNKETASLGVSK